MTLEERLRHGERPEDIAKEFADSLNAALAIINKEKDITNDAQLTADSWNHFVHSYFVVNKLPEGMTENDFYVQAEDMVKLLDAFVKTIPALDKYTKLMNDTEETLKKVQNKLKNDNYFKETVDNTAMSFDKAMKDFFNKMHI